MAWKKGQSGNPGGRSNSKDWATAIRMAVSETQGDHKKLRLLAEKVVSLAIEGDMQAMREIGDRLDGKPAQAVQHGGENGGDIIIRMVKDDDEL